LTWALLTHCFDRHDVLIDVVRDLQHVIEIVPIYARVDIHQRLVLIFLHLIVILYDAECLVVGSLTLFVFHQVMKIEELT
jgi:hypothetical protein